MVTIWDELLSRYSYRTFVRFRGVTKDLLETTDFPPSLREIRHYDGSGYPIPQVCAFCSSGVPPSRSSFGVVCLRLKSDEIPGLLVPSKI